MEEQQESPRGTGGPTFDDVDEIDGYMPSEVARLVLGYLYELNSFQAAKVFLCECPYLAEYSNFLKRGQRYPLTIGHRSLNQTLQHYYNLTHPSIPVCPPSVGASENENPTLRKKTLHSNEMLHSNSCQQSSLPLAQQTSSHHPSPQVEHAQNVWSFPENNPIQPPPPPAPNITQPPVRNRDSLESNRDMEQDHIDGGEPAQSDEQSLSDGEHDERFEPSMDVEQDNIGRIEPAQISEAQISERLEPSGNIQQDHFSSIEQTRNRKQRVSERLEPTVEQSNARLVEQSQNREQQVLERLEPIINMEQNNTRVIETAQNRKQRVSERMETTANIQQNNSRRLESVRNMEIPTGSNKPVIHKTPQKVTRSTSTWATPRSTHRKGTPIKASPFRKSLLFPTTPHKSPGPSKQQHPEEDIEVVTFGFEHLTDDIIQYSPLMHRIAENINDCLNEQQQHPSNGDELVQEVVSRIEKESTFEEWVEKVILCNDHLLEDPSSQDSVLNTPIQSPEPEPPEDSEQTAINEVTTTTLPDMQISSDDVSNAALQRPPQPPKSPKRPEQSTRVLRSAMTPPKSVANPRPSRRVPTKPLPQATETSESNASTKGRRVTPIRVCDRSTPPPEFGKDLGYRKTTNQHFAAPTTPKRPSQHNFILISPRRSIPTTIQVSPARSLAPEPPLVVEQHRNNAKNHFKAKGTLAKRSLKPVAPRNLDFIGNAVNPTAQPIHIPVSFIPLATQEQPLTVQLVVNSGSMMPPLPMASPPRPPPPPSLPPPPTPPAVAEAAQTLVSISSSHNTTPTKPMPHPTVNQSVKRKLHMASSKTPETPASPPSSHSSSGSRKKPKIIPTSPLPKKAKLIPPCSKDPQSRPSSTKTSSSSSSSHRESKSSTNKEHKKHSSKSKHSKKTHHNPRPPPPPPAPSRHQVREPSPDINSMEIEDFLDLIHNPDRSKKK